MTDYQVTYWRDLPAMAVVRDGESTTKTALAPRFQEAIDEAAMRLGDTGADEYLAGWRRGDWLTASGEPDLVLDRVVHELDDEWPAERLNAYLDELGPAAQR